MTCRKARWWVHFGLMTQDIIFSLLQGLTLSVIIAALAYWRGSLSRSGALGALIVGTLIFGLGGWVLSLIHI